MNKYLKEKPKNKTLRKGLETFKELGKLLNLFWRPELKVDQELIDRLLEFVKEIKQEDQIKFQTFDDLIGIVVSLREEARNLKDYEKSDKLRDGLEELGIVLEDTGKGGKWKFKKGF